MRKFFFLVIVTCLVITPLFYTVEVYSDSPYTLNLKNSSGAQIRSISNGDTMTSSDLTNIFEIESCDFSIYDEIVVQLAEGGTDRVLEINTGTAALYSKKVADLVNENKIVIKFNKISGGSDTVTVNLINDSNNPDNGPNQPVIPYKLSIKGISETREISNGDTINSSDLNSKFEINTCDKDMYNSIDVKMADGTTQNISNLTATPIFSIKLSEIIFNNRITLNFKKINGGSDSVTLNYLVETQVSPYIIQIINKTVTKKVVNGLKLSSLDLDSAFEITSIDGTIYKSISLSNVNGKMTSISNLLTTPVYSTRVSEVVFNNKITITFNKRNGGSDTITVDVVDENQKIPLSMFVKNGSKVKKLVNGTQLNEDDLNSIFEITNCDSNSYKYIEVKKSDGKVTRITNLSKSPVYTAKVSELIFEDKISIVFKKVDETSEIYVFNLPKSSLANSDQKPIIINDTQLVPNGLTENKVLEPSPYIDRRNDEPHNANKIIYTILGMFILGALVFIPGPIIHKKIF